MPPDTGIALAIQAGLAAQLQAAAEVDPKYDYLSAELD